MLRPTAEQTNKLPCLFFGRVESGRIILLNIIKITSILVSILRILLLKPLIMNIKYFFSKSRYRKLVQALFSLDIAEVSFHW